MLREDIYNNMKRIVDECMGDSMAQCVTNCPMHTDVKKYVRLIGEGRGEEALDVIREKLFLPRSLGRICAHPCESGCRRGDEHSPISIANLKRYAGDNFDSPERWDLTRDDATGKEVAVIGGGPAGAQAAIDLARSGHTVKLYERSASLGGMMRYGIPEYRLPRDIIESEFSIIEKMGVEVHLGCEIGRDIDFDLIKDESDAVVVAVGKQLGRIDRSLENHGAKGIYSAVEYLKEISERREFPGALGRVAVIGGGDVAMDCARSSLRLTQVSGVESILLEDSFEGMASSKHEVEGAVAEGVNFNFSRGIHRIEVDGEGRICALQLKRCTGMFDSEGRFAPVFDEDTIERVEVDTLIFAIGQLVDASLDVDNLLERRPNGNFAADPETLQSVSEKKVFVAGDCASSLIVVQAMAEGRRAAVSVDRFLRGEDLKRDRRLEDTSSYTSRLYLPNSYLADGWDSAEKVSKISMEEVDVEERLKGFIEVERGYTDSQAEQEAGRCLQCQCKLCMKECMMLPDYTDCPKSIFEEYLEKGYENMDKRIAYSCNECSQCTIRCPKDLELRENFMDMKRQYAVMNEGSSPMEGHIELDRGQELECSREYSTTVKAEKETKYLLVPGCTVPVYSPEMVEKTLDHLNEVLGQEVGAVLQCCAKPTLIIGEEVKFHERFKKVQEEIDSTGADVIITLCPSCYLTYDKFADQEVISYWDLMREKVGIPEKQTGVGRESDVVFNIHDACPTRDVESHHESIRWILDELEYKYEEMNNNRKNTRCCGVGGMAYCINPDQYERVVERRVRDATSDHIISYCGSCRGSMEMGGLDSLHILDLIHGDTYMKKQSRRRSEGVGLERRLKAKKLLEDRKK